MLIWRGLGFLVAVIVFGSSLAANFICNAAYGEAYWDRHKWPLAVSLIFSAVVCAVLGYYLRRRLDKIAVVKETGEEVVINRSSHTLFFIPMDWWAPVLAGIAVVVLVVEMLSKT